MADPRIDDKRLLEAFRHGAQASPDVLDPNKWLFRCVLLFEGTPLIVLSFPWNERKNKWEEMYDAVIRHIQNGPGSTVLMGVFLPEDDPLSTLPPGEASSLDEV